MAPFFLYLLPLKRTQLLFFSLIFFFLCYRATHPKGQSNTETHKCTHKDKPTDRFRIGSANGDAICGSMEVDWWWRSAFLGRLNWWISAFGVDWCLWRRSVILIVIRKEIYPWEYKKKREHEDRIQFEIKRLKR